jgi:hypothetical protein
MKKTTTLALAACAAVGFATAPLAADGPPAPRKERVAFAKGASSATIKGTLKGDGDVDYMVRAAAGQTLEVKLDASNGQNNFNVLPPGSANVAMYSSNMTGERAFKGVLPADGDYAIRVYLDRPAARRKETSKYTLTVAVSGKALPPLSAARDAKVAGTAYHATAKVPCALPYQPNVKSCDAGVVRRGTDGTATFESFGKDGVQRRILFVQGKVVAADTMDKVTATRQGDMTVVTISDNERYDIPDAFLNGG